MSFCSLKLTSNWVSLQQRKSAIPVRANHLLMVRIQFPSQFLPDSLPCKNISLTIKTNLSAWRKLLFLWPRQREETGFRFIYPTIPPQKKSNQNSLDFLKENLNRILDKTRTSAIASLQLLAKNIAGPEHQNHITKVSLFVSMLGKQLGLSEQHTQTFQNSITLYNSFRFILHNDLLSKPEKLTNEEHKTIEDLPYKLNEITDIFDYFAEERNILLSHNERYDGTGYPLGLKGDEISLGARIFNLVDSLAAMSSERPYRKTLNPHEILKELTKEAGKQFDPFLVLQILEVIKKNNLFNLDADCIDRAKEELINIFQER